MAATLFWTWAVVAGFIHGLGVFFIASFTIRGPWTWLDIGAGTGAILVLATTGYGHLVFLAVYLRRLQRRGAIMRVPKSIARFLFRVLDGASAGL